MPRNSVNGRHRQRLQANTTLRHNEQNYLAVIWRKIIPWGMLLLLFGKVRNGATQVKKCSNQIANILCRHFQQILFFGALLLFLELRQKRVKTFKDAWYKSKNYLVNRCHWAGQIFLEWVKKISRTAADSCYAAYTYLVYSYGWSSQKFLELAGKATEAVKNFWRRTTNFLYYHRQPISLPKLKPETKKTIITFCQKTKAYLDDRCQRIIQQFLLLVQIITRAIVYSSLKAYTYMVYYYQWTSQKFLKLVQNLSRTAVSSCYTACSYLVYSYQWTSRHFLELVRNLSRTTVSSCYTACMYLVYSYQWTSRHFLELTRKGALKLRKCWEWTRHFVYYYYQQISLIGALFIIAELLKYSFEKMMNIFMIVFKTLIANALKILTAILLILLIVTTVVMNCQLLVERNQLQEERKLLIAERRELIAEWRGLRNDWHRVQKMKESPPQEDEGFIYYAKKTLNILEAVLPLTKLFGLW